MKLVDEYSHAVDSLVCSAEIFNWMDFLLNNFLKPTIQAIHVQKYFSLQTAAAGSPM